MNKFQIVIIVVIISTSIKLSWAEVKDYSKELKLEGDQKKSYQEFKEAALKMDIISPHMKKDIILIKYFQDANHSVEEAKTKLKENLEWRAKKKIEELEKDEFDDMKKILPYQISFGKHGQPVLFFPGSNYNLAMMTLNKATMDRFTNYFYAIWEKMQNLLVKTHESNPAITRYAYIMDGDKFHSANVCPLCITFYQGIVGDQKRFPKTISKLAIVNMPAVAQQILDVTKSFLDAETRDGLEVVDSNPKNVKEFMLTIYNSESDFPKELYLGGGGGGFKNPAVEAMSMGAMGSNNAMPMGQTNLGFGFGK